MAPPSLIRSSTRSNLSICARCAFRASNRPDKAARRWVGTKYSAEAAEAENEWAEQAVEIKAGRQKSMFKKLEERGYIHTVTGTPKEVARMMTEKRVGAYVGIDPTASSLHVGHMLPLMSLFWMHVHGYHTITLLGGATAKIGDPSDRLTTRAQTHKDVRTQNMVSMHYQLENLWLNVDAYGRKYGYNWNWGWKRALLNNSRWWDKLTMIEVLQVLGPGMRLGSMLARDTVKNKMQKGDGMSFAEFTYPILQAWDWWTMYKANKIQMQIGGSDQFGNITAGIDAVKYIAANHPDPSILKEVQDRGTPFGFTVPLLTTSSGQKFGKSAGNAIWLDREQTSSFELYKFFLGTSDADVGRYLKLFTFMPIEEIDSLVEEHMQSPPQRKAQHKLAREFVELVHGEKEAQSAESQHRLIYTKNTMTPEEYAAVEAKLAAPSSAELPADGIASNANELPAAHLKLPRSVIEGANIGKLLLACGLATSGTEGHRLAAAQAIYVGGLTGKPEGLKVTNDSSISFTSINTWKIEDTAKFLVDDKLLILRRGKHFIRVIEAVSDAEYKELGLSYPGMRETVEAVVEDNARDILSEDKTVRYQGATDGEEGEVGSHASAGGGERVEEEKTNV